MRGEGGGGCTCAVRPTPPQNRLNGTARLCSMTSSRYFFAFTSSRPLSAMAVSRLFLKCTRRSEPFAYSRAMQVGRRRDEGAGACTTGAVACYDRCTERTLQDLVALAGSRAYLPIAPRSYARRRAGREAEHS